MPKIYLNLYTIAVIITFTIISIIIHFKSFRFKIIAKKLYIHKSVYTEISSAIFFSDFFGIICIFFITFIPIVNMLILFELLLDFSKENNEKKVFDLYVKFLDKNLKKIRLKDDEFNLIKASLLDTKSKNYELIYNKFLDIMSSVKTSNNHETDKKVEELKNLILTNDNCTITTLKETEKEASNELTFDKTFELDEKELKEYKKNISSNKDNIMKYLDNRTENKYKDMVGLTLSNIENPYYDIIIKNAYILSNIINEFENNNYILNHDKNEDTKNKIRNSIFEFIDVINLIDDLNYKQDKTFKNIENYNNYLESIKSDINKKIAIFGDSEHLV